MPIIDSGVTDNLEDAKKGVRQGVLYLVERERVKLLKFGITSQPQVQLKQFEKDGLRYNHLFLIYKTRSFANMKMLKEYLMSTYPDYCDNEIRDYDEKSGESSYFLYCATYIHQKKL
ncbi:MAG: hypothetical protein LUQ66_01405 [Methanoregula sp.]|nr:hypothetical protein [Methanoregula sp.]